MSLQFTTPSLNNSKCNTTILKNTLIPVRFLFLVRIYYFNSCQIHICGSNVPDVASAEQTFIKIFAKEICLYRLQWLYCWESSCVYGKKPILVEQVWFVDFVAQIPKLINDSNTTDRVVQQFYWYVGKEANMTGLYHLLIMLYKEDLTGCRGNQHFQNHKCLLKISGLLKSCIFWGKKELKISKVFQWFVFPNSCFAVKYFQYFCAISSFMIWKI